MKTSSSTEDSLVERGEQPEPDEPDETSPVNDPDLDPATYRFTPREYPQYPGDGAPWRAGLR